MPATGPLYALGSGKCANSGANGKALPQAPPSHHLVSGHIPPPTPLPPAPDGAGQDAQGGAHHDGDHDPDDEDGNRHGPASSQVEGAGGSGLSSGVRTRPHLAHVGPVPAGSRLRGELRPVPASGISPASAEPQANEKAPATCRNRGQSWYSRGSPGAWLQQALGLGRQRCQYHRGRPPSCWRGQCTPPRGCVKGTR